MVEMSEKNMTEDVSLDELLRVLSSEYESIYLVDLNNNSFVPYKMANRVVNKYGDYFASLPSYETAIQKYINDSVDSEDVISMLQDTSISELKKNLDKISVFIKDYTSIHDNGEKKHYRLKATTLLKNDKEFKVVLGFADVGFQKEKELEHYAYYDAVTGGYNYNYFKENMANIPDEGYMISMDIRSFKIINKVCGIKVGDIVIKAIYKNLCDLFEKLEIRTLLGRINADHFVFYINSLDKDLIESLLNQITIGMVNLSSKMHTPQLIPYFGITSWNDTKKVELAYSEANTAKHEVKENSEFNFVFYSEEDANRLLMHKEMEDSFEVALNDHEFEVWYQKKCNPRSGALTGAEALIRWRRKDGTLVPPGEFIPLFEQDGMIRRLDEYVFREVCRQQKVWKDKGYLLVPVSVNVSRASLYFWDIVDIYKQITEEYEIDPKFVPIEITESATIGNSDIREIVKCFNRSGFSLHMDDFGTGYSSLATLNMMHFDALKLDKSLIDFIGDYSGDRLLEHTITLAKELGMYVTAEGVEKKEQIDFLNRHSCDSVQGYFYAKPQVLEEFEQSLSIEAETENVEDIPAVYVSDTGSGIEDSIYLQAMDALIKTFHKILKINLTNDTYEIIKFYCVENDETKGFAPTISAWMKSFADSGQVHKDDLDAYLHVMNVDYLKKAFISKKSKITLRYRRLTNNEYRWVLLEIVPALDYSDTNQTLMLYVQDIQDSYVAQLENQRELEKFANTDLLTGLYSLHYYKKDVRTIALEMNVKSVGLIFADLNGLKIINDTYSHQVGNELICKFAKKIAKAFGKRNCYRIAGDEFVILLKNIPQEKFVARVECFYADIKSDLIPMASMGWQWSSSISDLTELLSMAEKNMYKEKHLFYKAHPEYTRDAIEKSYQHEVTSVIRVLSEQYYILGIVDLKEDSFKIFKNNLPKNYQKNGTTYSEYVHLIAKNRGNEADYKKFIKLADINWLKEKLKDRKSFLMDIGMKSGRTYTFSLIVCDSEDGEATKMIFSATDASIKTDAGGVRMYSEIKESL